MNSPQATSTERPKLPAREVASLSFTEKMTGHFSIGDHDFEEGRRLGKAAGSPFTFVLTITIPDMAANAKDPSTPAPLHGYVEAPALSPDRLEVPEGVFRLLVPNPDEVETMNMRYSMPMIAKDGKRYHFEGFKRVHHGPILRGWPDTSTLFITITEGDSPDGPLVGRGVIIIKLPDFAKQVSTMRVRGVKGLRRKASAMGTFGKGFLGRLVPVYAGQLDSGTRFRADGDGTRRALRMPAPEVRWCDGARRWHDGTAVGPDAFLKLTRYQGGAKGPLLLAAGYAMAADSLATPTIDTTLAEYAYERGYDVWLFDYRASIQLPSCTTSFTIDDVACVDYPEAVAEVRRVTGADSVQFYGHCVGSAAILMALGAGMTGVRSAVCSQFTLHPVTSRLNRFKNAMHVGDVMQWLRLKTVKPNTEPTFVNKLMDAALVVVPGPKGERCGRPICRWLNAIFGLTHNHSQLNDATHESFDEAFGFANVTGLRHTALIMKKGLAVDASGNAVYTQHPERLAIPLLFVQGSRNHIFRPSGTHATIDWLAAANGPSLYDLLYLEGYAHLDTAVGKNCPTEVFPAIFEHLDRFNAPEAAMARA